MDGADGRVLSEVGYMSLALRIWKILLYVVLRRFTDAQEVGSRRRQLIGF
jgi:hypothetical protein